MNSTRKRYKKHRSIRHNRNQVHRGRIEVRSKLLEDKVQLAAAEQGQVEAARTQRASLVTKSARAYSYILSKQVQKTCSFWLLTV